MNKRSMAGLALATVMVLGACGSDAPAAMDEDDFVDAMTELCEDAQAAADEADLPASVDDFAGVEDYADEGLDVLGEMLDGLRELVPPKDMAKDFEQFVGVVEDKIEQVEAMKAAAKDEDEDAIVDANEEMGTLLEDQAEAADDLGIDACHGSFQEGGDSETTLPATETTLPVTETTLPVTETTLPATVTTLSPITLPVTVPPSAPSSSTGGPSGGGIELSTLADLYAAPAGYTLVDTPAEDIEAFIDVIESDPDLAATVSQVGVGVFVDAAGSTAATVVIAVTRDGVDVMPESWIGVLCDPATRSGVTTPGGLSGFACPGTVESGIVEVFTQTRGAYGFSIATFSGSVSALNLADEFAAANI